MSQENEKNLLETVLEGLGTDGTLTEEEVANEKDKLVETAVYKVWGEDEDQDAEEKEEAAHSEEEEEAEAYVTSGAHEEDEEEKSETYEEEEEEKEVISEPGYNEEEDEVEEDAHEEEDDDDDDEDDDDEVVEPADDEPIKPEGAHEDEDEEASEGMHDEDEDKEASEGMHDEDEEVEEDEEAEEGYHEEDEMEEEEMEEEEDEVVTSIEQISKTITAAATQKAMDKINATYNSMKEDVDALCAEDETLTEEFKTKAATIFEAAVSAKVRSQVEEIAEEYKESVQEQVKELHEDLVEKIDSYMTYVAEQWVEKNEIAVTNALRTEIAESFMSSLKHTFEDHYIEMPEGKTDMFDEISSQNAELQETIKEQEDKNRKLTLQLVEAHRKSIVAEASEDLVDTQAAKFAELIKDVKFESTSKFKEKVATIKESYFSQKKVEKPIKSEKAKTNVKVVTEEIVENKPSVDPLMEKYLKAAGRLEVSHK